MFQCIELIDRRDHLNQKNVFRRICNQQDISKFLAENQSGFDPASVGSPSIPEGYLGEISYQGEKYLFWDCEVIWGEELTIFKLYLKEYSFAVAVPHPNEMTYA